MNSTVDLLSDPVLLQNESFTFNTTSVYRALMPPVISKAINILVIAGLTIAMVSLGSTLEVSTIKHHIVRPKGVVIGTLAQYGVMPLTAFCLAKVGLTIMMIGLLAICILCSIGVGGSNLTVLAPPLMAIAVLMPLTGYTFGYVISALFKLNPAERRTVAMETGCQNNQLCSTILRMAFPPAMVGPLFLFPLVYSVVTLIEAGVLVMLFRGHQMFKEKD